MIRLFISIIFMFSVMAASSSHAAMTPKIPMESHKVLADFYGADTCLKQADILTVPKTKRCTKITHQSSGSQRCQVDLAPFVERRIGFRRYPQAERHHTRVSIFADWLSEPILDPPRTA